MADAKEIEIKLKATGGDAAAKEVAGVGKAVESVGTEASEAAAKVGELADATEEATKPQASPTKLVPAWEEVAEAVEDAGEAVEELGEKAADAAGEAEDLVEAIDPLTDVEIEDEWLKALSAGAEEAGIGMDELAGYVEILTKHMAKLPGPIGTAAGGLARLLPLLGSAGPHVALFTAALGAGILSAKAIIDHLDEIAAAAKRGFPEMADASGEAEIKAANLAAATGDAAQAADYAAGAFGSYSARLREAAREQAALADAELGVELAGIDLDEIEGRLTKEEAVSARHDARRLAAERKRAAEIQAIEDQIASRASESDRLKEIRDKASAPARRAQWELDRLRNTGASSLYELEDEVKARNAAIRARAAAEGRVTDPEELDALDQAVTDTQAALSEAFGAMVEAAIQRRDETRKVVLDAEREMQASLEHERRLKASLESETSGTGAAIFDTSRRQEDLRNRAELARIEATKKEAERRASEQAAADEAKRKAEAARAAADEEARRIASDAAGSAAAGRSRGADPATIAALDQAATKLSDGTNLNELGGAILRLSTAAENLAAEEAATVQGLITRMRAAEAKLATVESQIRNNPNRR